MVKLGNHYTVIKHKDAEAISGPEWAMVSTRVMLDRIEELNRDRGQREYLVLESDWPEYEPVKQALLARINGTIKGDLKYIASDNSLKLDVSDYTRLLENNLSVNYIPIQTPDDAYTYTEWLDQSCNYHTLPRGAAVQPLWVQIPNGAQVFTRDMKFFKWIGDLVYVLRKDEWEPTGYKNVADFMNYNYGKLNWQREPLFEDKTKAQPEDTLVQNSKADVMETYWQGLTHEQKRAALAHVMQVEPVAERREEQNLAHVYPHYHKDVSKFKSVDVYRVIDLFGVTDHAQGHAIKKLLCAGVRGDKNYNQDIKEARDTLNRRLQMLEEEQHDN